MSIESSRCWAEINRSALLHNAAIARERVGNSASLLAVIKANGYGHGLTQMAETLAPVAQLFGVANLEEAREARSVSAHPIVILGPALPDERARICELGFIPSVSSYEEALEFDRAAGSTSVAINFVLDTGMGRMGAVQSEAVANLRKVSSLDGVTLHSISTHLPAADEDADFTTGQLQQFSELVRQIRREIPGDYKVHALLSAGILAHSEQPFDIVRAGLMLYGISPLPEFQKILRPAMALKSRVVLLRNVDSGTSVSYGRTFITSRPSRLATIGAGYADGYSRSLSNRDASVLIGGKRCPVLGRVTMDLIVADVTDLPDVGVGDEVVLIGGQGHQEILASDLAARAGTIAWEVFTGIGSRVRRVYL